MLPAQLATVQTIQLDPFNFHLLYDHSKEDLETAFECMTGLRTVYLRRHPHSRLFTDLNDEMVSDHFKLTGR